MVDYGDLTRVLSSKFMGTSLVGESLVEPHFHDWELEKMETFLELGKEPNWISVKFYYISNPMSIN